MSEGTQRPDGCAHFNPYELNAETVYDVYRDLRERCPIAHSDAFDGFWVLSRYRDVFAAVRDHGTYSSAQGVHVPRRKSHVRVAPLDYDPPEHTAYRNLMAGPLAQGAVARLEPFIRDLVAGLVRPVVARGGGELVSAISTPMPLQVICHVLGLSEQASIRVRELTERMWKEFETHGDQAREPLAAFLMGEVNARRAAPRDDFITQLIHAEVQGRHLSDAELGSILVALANAGHQTTMNAASNALLRLAEHPEEHARLRAEPALIPSFVEESLRLAPPVQMFARTVTRDTSVDGVTFRDGESVMLLYAAANRDPEQFPDPDAYVIGRPNNRHLSFGWGIHFCLGAPLARTELRLLLEEVVQHPPFRLVAPPTYSGMEGGHHLGITSLQVTFEP